MPETMPANKKKLFILLGVLVVIVIIIIVAASSGSKKPGTNSSTTKTNVPKTTEQNNNTPEGTNATNENASGTPAEQIVDMTNAQAAIPGASLITKDNKVVTAEGKVAKNDVIPASADAPKAVVIAKDQLPKQAINIDIKNGAFSPAAFTVAPNQPVSFAITSADSKVHVVIFSNAVLGAIAMGIGPGETKAITFNAPAEPGEYEFRCDVPGHRGSGAGELGKMIVK